MKKAFQDLQTCNQKYLAKKNGSEWTSSSIILNLFSRLEHALISNGLDKNNLDNIEERGGLAIHNYYIFLHKYTCYYYDKMVQFFNFIIASMLFSTDVLPNVEDVRHFKIFIPALEYFSGELRVVLYLGDLNIIHTWKQGNIYWIRPMVTHCVPWLGSFTEQRNVTLEWQLECHNHLTWVWHWQAKWKYYTVPS